MTANSAPATTAVPAERQPTAGVPNVWLLDGAAPAPLAAFVQQHPDAGLYHTPAWYDALRSAGVGRLLGLVATCGEAVTGILPLALVPDPAGRGRLVSLPATPAAGILAQDAAAAWLLASRALHLAEARGLDGVRVRHFVSSRHLATPAHGETVLDWVRLPLRDVLNQVSAGDRSRSAVRPLRSAPLTAAAARAFDRTGTGIPPAMLRTLADDARISLRATFADVGDDRIVLGAWATVNRHVHVIAVAGQAAHTDLFAGLLVAAARDGATAGADWIDFPCPSAVGQTTRTLLRSPHVHFACECPLDVAAAAGLARPEPSPGGDRAPLDL